jgi:sulfide:quinone oxidoreductase
VVLGAGFGGLELSTMLSESGGDFDVTLIDKSDAFIFGYSKLEVMFERATPQSVSLAYRDIAKPAVRVLKETVTAIDPEARQVTTDAGFHEADVLVIALGADCDMAATPCLAEAGNEFYSLAGAERLAQIIPAFSEGHAVVGVCGALFKCPPAPSEYIEFGDGRVGRVDIDFLSGPTRTGTFNAPSAALAAEKDHFGSSRRARWFAG